MVNFDWNPEKSLKLKVERGLSFEDIVTAINADDILEDFSNPNLKKYPNQRILIVKINRYAYLVPYVENGQTIFLKTIIPSRKATKKYIINNQGSCLEDFSLLKDFS